MTGQQVRTGDGVVLHARVDGDPLAPPLLLVNSLGTDLASWDTLTAAWSPSRRILRYDQRGHGRSEAPPGPYTIDQLGSDALAVLDAYEVERADVCGVSLGGLVAQWLAANAPTRVRRVVLADTAARIGTPEAWQARAALVRERGMTAVIDTVLERFFSPTFRATGGPALAAVEAGLRETDAEGYAASCDALATADLRRATAGVVAPCLVLVGTADEATPPSDAQDLLRLLSGAADTECAELAGAGHLAHLEQPADFGRLVADFLDRV